MSDISAAPEGAETPAPAEAAPAAPAPEAIPDAWPEAARSKIGELREENASYRKTWQPFERAMASMHENDRGLVLQALQAIASPDAATRAAGVEFWLANGEALVGDRWAELLGRYNQSPAPEQETPAEIDFSDPDAVRKMIADQVAEQIRGYDQTQEQKRTEAEMVAKINKELDDLHISDDERKFVLTLAQMRDDADIGKAHEDWTALKETFAKDFLDAKKAAGTTSPAPSNGNSARTETSDEQKLSPAEKMAQRFRDQGLM